MGKGQHIIQRLAEETEVLPGHPIVELSGDRRVLIENHCGVREYGRTRITVKMRYGEISILGEGLEILRMTKAQLVIRGTIGGLSLQRRRNP